MILQFILVGFGGAIGSMLRYGIGLLSLKFLGTSFPWGTLSVNILGSLCIGILFGALSQMQNFSESLKLFTMVGILGGFTTFSAFSLDTILLFERGQYVQAGLYIIGSIVLSLAATMVSLFLIRASI